jgi:ubiquitin-like protein Pup
LSLAGPGGCPGLHCKLRDDLKERRMAGDQVRRQRPAREQDEDVESTEKVEAVDTSDVDDLLDEIDEVLEENAEEFVKNYVQKGGE